MVQCRITSLFKMIRSHNKLAAWGGGDAGTLKLALPIKR